MLAGVADVGVREEEEEEAAPEPEDEEDEEEDEEDEEAATAAAAAANSVKSDTGSDRGRRTTDNSGTVASMAVMSHGTPSRWDVTGPRLSPLQTNIKKEIFQILFLVRYLDILIYCVI